MTRQVRPKHRVNNYEIQNALTLFSIFLQCITIVSYTKRKPIQPSLWCLQQSNELVSIPVQMTLQGSTCQNIFIILATLHPEGILT